MIDVPYINNTVNQIQFGPDSCVKYARAKYEALIAAGWDKKDIQLLIVDNKATKSTHMIVSIFVDNKWIVLDNLTSLRPDLKDYLKYKPFVKYYDYTYSYK